MQSCNTTFAQIGLDLGDRFPPGMERFGIGTTRHRSTSTRARSRSIGRRRIVADDAPRYALAGIGQGDVATTPLQMALVAAGIGNGGIVMEPHVGGRDP